MQRLGGSIRVYRKRAAIATALSLLNMSTSSACAAFSTSTPTTNYIDKLALVLVENRKQLVVRSQGKQVFFTPGGKREPGETDEQALVRECQEELTIDLIPSTIQPYGVFSAQAFGKSPGIKVRMTCYTAQYRGQLTPNEEIEELRWITSTCPHEDLTVTGVMLLEDLQKKGLID